MAGGSGFSPNTSNAGDVLEALPKIGLIVLLIAIAIGVAAGAKMLVAGRVAWRFLSSPMLLGVLSIVCDEPTLCRVYFNQPDLPSICDDRFSLQ